MCTGIGGSYVRTSEDANFGLQMRLRPHFEQERYQISFEAYSRRMGIVMNANALEGLIEEAENLCALVVELEMQQFHPTHAEYQAFLSDLEQNQETAPTMEQTF